MLNDGCRADEPIARGGRKVRVREPFQGPEARNRQSGPAEDRSKGALARMGGVLNPGLQGCGAGALAAQSGPVGEDEACQDRAAPAVFTEDHAGLRNICAEAICFKRFDRNLHRLIRRV